MLIVYLQVVTQRKIHKKTSLSGPTAVSFQGNYLICWNLSVGITLLKLNQIGHN
jgi:hypothetical protein